MEYIKIFLLRNAYKCLLCHKHVFQIHLPILKSIILRLIRFCLFALECSIAVRENNETAQWAWIEIGHNFICQITYKQESITLSTV